MKCLVRPFLFTTLLVPLDVAADDSIPQANRDETARLVFADDFERRDSGKSVDDLGRGWKTNAHEPWSKAPKQAYLRDGAIHVVPAEGQQSGVLIYRYTHFFNGGVRFRFLLPKEKDQIRLVVADNSLKDVHAGHVLSVRLESGRVTLTDMLSGGFDPEIYSRRKAGKLTQSDQDRINACHKTQNANIQLGHWHHAYVSITQDRLQVRIDDQPAVTFQSPGFKNRKSELRISVPRSGAIDDFEHEIADPEPTDSPKHLLVTRRFESKFQLIEASAEQIAKLERISLAHRRFIHGLRERVRITKQMVRERDKAFGEAGRQGLINRDLWKYVQERLQISDQQTESFRVTFERHQQFKQEALDLLNPQQLALFRKAKVAAASVGHQQSTAKQVIPVPSSVNRPNVLFIAIDDLNNHVLGLNGKVIANTPHLNQLAQQGTLFTNAHCAAPACNPSRASVMTGIAPYNSGVYENSQDWRVNEVLKDVTTLPQHFRDHGYKVLGGGKLYHAANLRETMLQGYLDPRPWHDYFPSKGRQLPDEVTPPGQAINGSNDFYGGRFDWQPLDITDDEMGDGKVVSWAEQQLSKKHDQPLFLGVGIYRPHIPWYTPKAWFAEYPLENIQVPEWAEGDLDDVPEPGTELARQHWHQWLIDNDKWDDATQAYLASVSFADAMVGRLIQALDRSPMANNTIIVLWSDHGYHLGHKRHWEKFALWRQTTQVPLIVVDRRQHRSEQRCERPVSLLDLYPTLSELCGIQVPKHLDGISLVPYLKDPNAPSERNVVVTHQRNNHAIQSQRWRYIRYADGSEELYDHQRDPEERHNLAGRPEHAALIRHIAGQLPQKNVAEDPVAGRKVKQPVR